MDFHELVVRFERPGGKVRICLSYYSRYSIRKATQVVCMRITGFLLALLLTSAVQAGPNLEEKIAQQQAQLDSLKGLQQEVNELKAQLAAQQ